MRLSVAGIPIMLILTEDAVLICNHILGRVSNQPSQSLVTIQGRKVLVENDPEGRQISSCPNSNPFAGMKPCQLTLRVQVGYSDLVRINGKRACLNTVSGLTDGTPPGTVIYKVREPGQTLVSEAA
jgi:hypothetical protein